MGANRTDEHTDRWTDGQHQFYIPPPLVGDNYERRKNRQVSDYMLSLVGAQNLSPVISKYKDVYIILEKMLVSLGV